MGRKGVTLLTNMKQASQCGINSRHCEQFSIWVDDLKKGMLPNMELFRICSAKDNCRKHRHLTLNNLAIK